MARRRNVKHGAIQVAFWRDSFVIMGSDTATVADMKHHHEYSSKFVCHDRVPLAIGVSGMAEYTINNKETVVTRSLRDQFLACGASSSVRFRSAMDWAKAILLPLVMKANATYPVDEEGHVTLMVGICNAGRAELGQFRVDHDVRFREESYNRSSVLYPETPEGWYSRRFRRGTGDPYGEKIAEPKRAAVQARSIIEDAIATDRKIARNSVPHCGVEAEVVMVDCRGARFIFEAQNGS